MESANRCPARMGICSTTGTSWRAWLPPLPRWRGFVAASLLVPFSLAHPGCSGRFAFCCAHLSELFLLEQCDKTSLLKMMITGDRFERSSSFMTTKETQSVTDHSYRRCAHTGGRLRKARGGNDANTGTRDLAGGRTQRKTHDCQRRPTHRHNFSENPAGVIKVRDFRGQKTRWLA